MDIGERTSGEWIFVKEIDGESVRGIDVELRRMGSGSGEGKWGWYEGRRDVFLISLIFLKTKSATAAPSSSSPSTSPAADSSFSTRSDTPKRCHLLLQEEHNRNSGVPGATKTAAPIPARTGIISTPKQSKRALVLVWHKQHPNAHHCCFFFVTGLRNCVFLLPDMPACSWMVWKGSEIFFMTSRKQGEAVSAWRSPADQLHCSEWVWKVQYSGSPTGCALEVLVT